MILLYDIVKFILNNLPVKSPRANAAKNLYFKADKTTRR